MCDAWYHLLILVLFEGQHYYLLYGREYKMVIDFFFLICQHIYIHETT